MNKKDLTIISDKEYIQMLEKIKQSYQDGQLKAAVSVNSEMYSPLNRPQLVDDLQISQSSGNFDKIFSIPWGHQRYITNNLPALQSDLANEMTRIANDSLTDLTVM